MVVLKPVLVSECLGYLSIGAILGAMVLPCFLAIAVGPYASGLFWEQGGYALAIPVAALAAALGATGLVAVSLSHRST